MSAAVISILGALSFAFGNVATRRAVIKVFDATVGVLITTPMSVLFL